MATPNWLTHSQLEQAEALINLGFEFEADPEYESLHLNCKYDEVDHWQFFHSQNKQPNTVTWKNFNFWEVQAVCDGAIYRYVANIDPADFEEADCEYDYYLQIIRQAVEEVRHVCDRQSGKQLVLAVDDALDLIPF
jgi:hypothetical protein